MDTNAELSPLARPAHSDAPQQPSGQAQPAADDPATSNHRNQTDNDQGIRQDAPNATTSSSSGAAEEQTSSYHATNETDADRDNMDCPQQLTHEATNNANHLASSSSSSHQPPDSASPATSKRHSELEQQQPQQVPIPMTNQPAANNRSVLLLREIDQNTSECSVKNIFNSENCPSKPIHCEHALNNSWYVTFKNDEDARLALGYIRKHIVKWNGKDIMARYKTKPANTSGTDQPPPHILPNMVMQTTATGPTTSQHLATFDRSVAVPAPTANCGVASEPAPTNSLTSTNRSHQAQQQQVVPTSATLMSPSASSQASTNAPTSSTPNLVPYGHHQQVNNLPMMHQQIIDGTNHLVPVSGQSSTQPSSHHHQQHLQSHHNHHQQQPHMSASSPHQYGYSAVAYYGQHGSVLAPWQYSEGPQYDLSQVFIYNGLAPYPASYKTNSSSKVNSSPGTISGAALLGGELNYQQHQHHQSSQHLHPSHHHHHAPHHYGPQQQPYHHHHHQTDNNNNGAVSHQKMMYTTSNGHHGTKSSTHHQRNNHKNNRHK